MATRTSSHQRMITLWIVISLGLLSNFVTVRPLSFASASKPTAIRQSSRFRWHAAVDKKTGLASSSETSRIIPQKNNKRHIQQLSQDFIASWPDFICKGSVTGGLFCNKNGAIRPRFLPIIMLQFGECIKRRKDAWEIPICGGLLALPQKRGDVDGDYGKLTFAIDNNTLQTNIVDYRPWLVGYGNNALRRFVYLHTQSYVHAYVTWRFYRAWREKLMED